MITRTAKKAHDSGIPKARKKHQPVAIDPSDFLEQKMFEQMKVRNQPEEVM